MRSERLRSDQTRPILRTCLKMTTVAGAAGLLVICVALLLVGGASSACDEDHFQCDNGQCAMPWLVCDGIKDCDDGSDEKEAKCNSAATATMAVGDVLTASVQYQYRHKGVLFSMHNDTGSSGVFVWGNTTDGTLKFFSNSNCNEWGWYCWTSIDSAPEGWAYFPTGDMVFVVERRPSELAVWRQVDPEHKATAPVTEDSHRLRVRPEYWMTDMPVTLDVGTTSTAASSPVTPPLASSTGATAATTGATTPGSGGATTAPTSASTPSSAATSAPSLALPFLVAAALRVVTLT